MMGVALALDGMANSSAGELLNDSFIVKDKCERKYGKWNETISDITGFNYLKKTLNKYGQEFRKLLDTVLGKNHCVDSIKLEFRKK